MAVRQYIGARYTLKIYENSLDPQSADWEANTAYEPLTMVNYNNSSYISRRTVPANIGNPVDNPTYWALSGLYNGQIANLQQQINDIGDRVTTAESDITSLDGRADTLEDIVKIITNKEYILFGDSWSDEDGSHKWVNSFCSRYGCVIHNYAESGAGYTISGNTIDMQIDAALADVANDTIDPYKIEKILILAGVNDAKFSSLQLVGGVGAQVVTDVNKIKANFPNSEVICIFNSGVGHVATVDTTFNTMREYSSRFCTLIGNFVPTYSTICWFDPHEYESNLFHLTADNRHLQYNIGRILGNGSPCDIRITTASISSTLNGDATLINTVSGSELILFLGGSVTAGDIEVAIPTNYIFDRYGAVWLKLFSGTSGATVDFAMTSYDYTNNKITFTTANNRLIRDTIIQKIGVTM